MATQRETDRQREKQKDRDTAVMQTIVASSDCLVSARNPYLREGLSTVELLTKIGYFIKK